MKITTGSYCLSLIVAFVVLGGCASSQPKLTQEQVLSQYPEISSLVTEVKNAKAEGSEYLAPESYTTATKSLESATNAAYNNESDKAKKAVAEGSKVIDKMKRDTSSSRELLTEVLQARERAIN